MTLTLTRYEAAMLCGISVHTFDEWVSKGILPPPLTENRRSAFEEWKRANAH
jgi:predicted site-specific integrase-resolvase